MSNPMSWTSGDPHPQMSSTSTLASDGNSHLHFHSQAAMPDRDWSYGCGEEINAKLHRPPRSNCAVDQPSVDDDETRWIRGHRLMGCDSVSRTSITPDQGAAQTERFLQEPELAFLGHIKKMKTNKQ